MRKTEKNTTKRDKKKNYEKQPKKNNSCQNRTKYDKICQKVTKQKPYKICCHNANIIYSFTYSVPNQKKCQIHKKKEMMRENAKNSTKTTKPDKMRQKPDKIKVYKSIIIPLPKSMQNHSFNIYSLSKYKIITNSVFFLNLLFLSIFLKKLYFENNN
jgi:hypothetical protein